MSGYAHVRNGSKATLWPCADHFRCAPDSGHAAKPQLLTLCAKAQSRCDRDRGEPRGSAPPTPPCVRVRTRRFEKLRQRASINGGRPSDLKWALESPTERALLRAMYHGPRPLSAVLHNAQRLAMRSVPHGGDVVFSTDATERPAIATGPSE